MSQSALGNLFKLLALAHRAPTASCVRLIADGTLPDDIRATWVALGLPAAPVEAFCDVLAAYRGRGEDEVLYELRREYTRLFLGDRPLVRNCEGPWRKTGQGIEVVALMVNSFSVEVADFMRYCGVTKGEGYNDCVDYIDNEFDFAGLLADQPTYLAEKGIDALDKLDEFIDGHLMLWVEGYCEDVIANTYCGYYTALCGLTREFMAVLKQA